MPIFVPSPENINSDFSAIKAKKDADYQNHQSIWNVFWQRCNINVRLEAGDPTIMNTWGNNPGTMGSSNFYMNRCRPIGLMLSGYQRRNRKSSIFVPGENGDQYTADQLTNLQMKIYKKENVYEKISEAFHEGCIISGMNLMRIYLDFSNDPLNGDPKFENLAFNQFMIDPYFEQPDLSDASFIMVRSYKTKPAIAHICPPSWYDEIMALEGNQQGSTIDGRFQYEAAARGYSMAPKLAYDEYWYRDYRMQKKVYDKSTGEITDITEFQPEQIEIILAENPQLELEEKTVSTIRLCIAIQDKIFYDGPNPYGLDCYPFVAFIGYYSKSMPYMYNRIQSVMTSLISPQILFNRRLILNSDFLEAVVNNGFMFKQGAVLDAKHLLQTGQGRLIPLKDHATPLVDVVPIPPPKIDVSAFTQLELLDKELFNVTGISQENLGKVVEDDASGYKTALRTSQGLTASETLFSHCDRAQDMLGDIFFDIIKRNWTPGKVSQILGNGEKPAPIFFDRAFGKYHCVSELGFNTETQKQLEFAQLLELRKAGIAIPDSTMIQKATLQGKDEIIEQMNQMQQQQQQMQQMQMQYQMQELQSRAELQKARAAADIGLYNERTSRVEENRALAIQKLHEANKEDAQATLDKIKAIKELQSIDLDHVQRLIEMLTALRQQETDQVEKETNAVAQPAPAQRVSQEAQQGAETSLGV